jgi:hypothetical protein
MKNWKLVLGWDFVFSPMVWLLGTALYDVFTLTVEPPMPPKAQQLKNVITGSVLFLGSMILGAFLVRSHYRCKHKGIHVHSPS